MKWRALAASREPEKFPEAPGALGTPEWKGKLVLGKLPGCADQGASSGSLLRGLFHKSPHRLPLLPFPPRDTRASLPEIRPPAVHAQARLWLRTCFAFRSQETAEPSVADCSTPLSLSP